MNTEKDAVLIVAYRRYENTKKIIDLCILNGIPRIYVVVDFPANEKSEAAFDVARMKEQIIDVSNSSLIPIQYRFRESNSGCAASILSACDWFFEHEDFGIILEDDCIPSNGFFQMISCYKEQLISNKDIWMICGTQFAPESLFPSEAALSKYALIWGWASSSSKWNVISQSLRDSNKFESYRNLISPESIYWNAGSRRAINGFVDVWDTAVLNAMHQRKKYAILPKKSLVQNIGNDPAATHTKDASPWLNRDVGTFHPDGTEAKYSKAVDQWLNANFYKISARHILTTRITFLLDIYRKYRERPTSLQTRWDKASKELNALKD